MPQNWKTGVGILFQNVILTSRTTEIDSDAFLYYQELELFQVKAYI